MKVVVFAPTASDLALPLATLADLADVTVLSTESSEWQDATAVAVGVSPRMVRWSSVAQRTVAGRVLRRLTPLDPGVMFARQVRRSAAAQAAIAAADVLVSAERDAHFSVWQQARRRQSQGHPVSAVSGFPAARAALRLLRNGGSARGTISGDC